jgi:hypothetical protein
MNQTDHQIDEALTSVDSGSVLQVVGIRATVGACRGG